MAIDENFVVLRRSLRLRFRSLYHIVVAVDPIVHSEKVMPRSNEEILARLTELEQQFDVDQWEHLGVHLWPLVRYQIATENHRLAKVSPGRSDAVPAGILQQKLSSLRPLLSMGRGLRDYLRATQITDPAHNDSMIRPANALFYSDGASITKLDDHWYDRFCDPLHSALALRNVSTLTWQPLHTYYTPRHTRSAFIQPLLDTVLIAARVEKAVHARLRSAQPALDSLSDALAWLAAKAPEFNLLSIAQYLGLAQYTARFARAYTPWIKRVGPKVAFKVCYYGAEGMGFVLACRQLKIPVVDLQHGVAGAQHFAYGAWTKVPPGGYNTLPTHFWCWSEADSEAILRWNGPAFGHIPIVGGNPFLSAWVRGEASVIQRSAAVLAPLVGRTEKLKQVLWTAHGFEDDETLQRIAKVVHESRGHIHWWIRMHPVRAHRKADFLRVLAQTEGDYNLDEASALPVYALLRVVDAHATEVSSTTIEAAAFGVPTVLVCPSEVGLFADLVQSGWATIASEYSSLIGAIDEQIGKRLSLRAHTLSKSIPQSDAATERALTSLGLTTS